MNPPQSKGNVYMNNKDLYHLRLKKGVIWYIELEGKKIKTFQKPATSKKLHKLYIIKHLSNIVYIGFTCQSIRTRLQSGLIATGDHGYYGYQWKKLDKIDLCIVYFPGKSQIDIEALEAELVYLVRKNTGKWPSCQTEIHFHNISKKVKDEAKLLYNDAVKMK